MPENALSTLGIEEEYLLVDPETRDLVDMPDAMMKRCQEALGERVAPELMRSQIEVGTRPCATVSQAIDDLKALRQTVSQSAAKHGLAIIASSSHPFAKWRDQRATDRPRYQQIAHHFQTVVQRLIISGMHIHVGFAKDQDDLRMDLMNQVAYFLPHILCLSTSSPFWEGEDTGLMCYRLTVFDTVPRTGLPEAFNSYEEFMRNVAVLVDVGAIEDTTKIWWDVRPSAKFPTLEMRISDICTNIQDTAAIAALYLSLLRVLYKLRVSNQRWRTYSPLLINENRWRAQRYGIDGKLVDFGLGKEVPYADLLEEMITMVRDEAIQAGCQQELEQARQILVRGTSAHKQRTVYQQAITQGLDKHTALRKVVDFLIEETLAF